MFNPLERIRKLANMPDMQKGYPPPDRRKCSDWAAVWDAVDTVTRELVDQLMQCQATGLRIATEKALMASRLAEATELVKKSEQKQVRAQVANVCLQRGFDRDTKEDLAAATVVN